MKAKVKLAFRITIQQNSSLQWDKYIFEDTYREYKIQHQVFNSKENPVDTYWELVRQNPHAEKIPFLLSASVQGYISQLNGKIRSLPDVLGTSFFEFNYWKLDLVSSNSTDASKHKVGITFYTDELLLIDVIDNKYLLSKNLNISEGLETFMFPFHHQVSVCFYEKI